MSDKDFNNLDPIVPERDEMAAGRNGGKGKKGPPPSRPKKTASAGGSGAGAGAGWKVLVMLLLLGLAALAYYSWRQSLVLADLNERFSLLAERIESTDESLSESGAALSVKIRDHDEALEKHWAEIKKLWGVSYDTNRKAIAANEKAIEGQARELKKTGDSLAFLKAEVEKARDTIAAVRSDSLAVNAEMEQVRGQLSELSTGLDRLERSLKEAERNLGGRVSENEEAIKAIDSYRQQINQQMNQLRQRLDGS